MICTSFKNLFVLVFFLNCCYVVSQDTVQMQQVYIDNELVYKVSDKERFTGVAQFKRKNGHLVYEEEYKDGVILSYSSYFNGKEKIIAHKTIFNRYKLWTISKEYGYNLKSELTSITSYNENGIRILEEEFESGQLTYSCQYLGKKKHGIAFCYSKDGEKLTFEYVHGKKKK